MRKYLLAILGSLTLVNLVPAAEPVRFLADVAPILVQRCTGCHDTKKSKGEYRLHTYTDLMKPGESDAKSIVAGKPKESELFRRISSTKPDQRMPPGDEPLTAAEQATIQQWITEGAKFDGSDTTALLKTILPPRTHPLAPERYPAPSPVLALAFAPDGKTLAVGGHHEVTIWDPSEGKLLRRIQRLPQRIHAIAFDKDGKRMLVGGGSAGEYGEVTVIDTLAGTKIRTLGTFDDLVLGIAWSPDFSAVAVACADGSVTAYEVKDGKRLWKSQYHSDWVTGIAYSPDGKFVVSSGKDRTLKVHDAPTGSLYTTFNGHQREFGPQKGRFDVYDVAFDTNGNAISAGEGSALRVWNPVKAREEAGSAADMEERFAKAGHTRYLSYSAKKPIFKLAVKGGAIFSACGDTKVRQHDLTTPDKESRIFTGHRDWVYAIDFHPESQRLATGSFDGEVRIWDTKTGQTVKAFIASPGR